MDFEKLNQMLVDWTGEIDGFMYTYILVILLVFVGIYFTIRTKGVQIRYIKDMFTQLTEKKHVEGEKSISSFQALMVSTASRVGTGNIAGIATAVATGGPGAIFWMWLMALIGAASAFIESTLAQIYKIRGKEGEFRGGPAYYIQQGLGQRWLGIIFAWALILCFAFGFNGLQAFNMTSALEYYIPDYATNGTAIGVGIVLIVFTAFVIFGGAKRISIITSIIVPIMAILYVLGSLIVLIMNAANIPATFALIFECAFNPAATVGGATFGIIAAISQGAKRGLFSNEAGMGSTPHAHALAEVRDPHEQGVVAMIGVFVDTIVVVTMTALVVLSTLYVGDGMLATGDYASLTAETITKTNIAQLAFGQFFGEGAGAWFVAICLLFFAFSTILSWNLFAKLNVEWLFGKRAVLPFTVIALVFIFLGSLLSNDLVWEMADMFNQLMVIPNAIALFALSGAVLAIANAKHDKRALDVAEEKLADRERAAMNAMVEKDERK